MNHALLILLNSTEVTCADQYAGQWASAVINTNNFQEESHKQSHRRNVFLRRGTEEGLSVHRS